MTKLPISLAALVVFIFAITPCGAAGDGDQNAGVPQGAISIGGDDTLAVPLTYDPVYEPIPLVPVSVNGKAVVPFALDTSFPGFAAIASGAVKALGLTEQTDSAGDKTVSIDQLNVVGASGAAVTDSRKIEAPVLDPSALNLTAGRLIGGELGMAFFASQVSRIDFAHNMWTLYEDKPDLGDVAGATVLPLTTALDGSPTVGVDLGKGQHVDLMIDTTATTTSIPLAVADKLAPVGTINRGWHYQAPTLYLGPNLVLGSVGLGNASVSNVIVSPLPNPAQLALGLNVLNRFAVGIDGPHGKLILTPSDDQFGDGCGWTGISFDLNDLHWIVKRVEPKSPADAAGVRAGDEITRVDDHSVEDIPNVDAVRILEGDSQTPVTLTVKRQGVTAPFSAIFVRGSLLTAVKHPTDGLTLAVSSESPLRVLAVEPGCPADKAGLRAGDRLTSVGGIDTRGRFELDELPAATAVGQLHMDVSRLGVASGIAVTLTADGGSQAGPESLAPSDRPLTKLPVLIRDGKSHVIPFQFDGVTTPNVLVHATVDGKPMLFAVDTGVVDPVRLEPWAVDELGLKTYDSPGGKIVNIVSFGLIGKNKADVARLAVKDAIVVDDGFSATYGVGRVAGLIGMPALAGMSARFDFDANVLTLKTGKAAAPAKSTVLPLTFTHDGLVAVSARFDSTHSVDLIVDTGSTGAVIPVTDGFAVDDRPTGGGAFVQEASETYACPTLMMSSLKFGDLTIKGVSVGTLPETSPTPCMAGLDILSQFDFTLDLPGRRVILERRRSPLRHDGAGWTGVDCRPDPSGVIVSAVEPGSPADQAGVKVGDLVTAVDGRSLADLTTGLSSQLVRWGDVDSRAAFSILRDGKPLSISFTRLARWMGPTSPLTGLMLDKPAGGPIAVAGAMPGCAGDKAGIEDGDVIVAIDNRPTASIPPDQLGSVFSPGDHTLEIARPGVALPLTVDLKAEGNLK